MVLMAGKGGREGCLGVLGADGSRGERLVAVGARFRVYGAWQLVGAGLMGMDCKRCV